MEGEIAVVCNELQLLKEGSALVILAVLLWVLIVKALPAFLAALSSQREDYSKNLQQLITTNSSTLQAMSEAIEQITNNLIAIRSDIATIKTSETLKDYETFIKDGVPRKPF